MSETRLRSYVAAQSKAQADVTGTELDRLWAMMSDLLTISEGLANRLDRLASELAEQRARVSFIAEQISDRSDQDANEQSEDNAHGEENEDAKAEGDVIDSPASDAEEAHETGPKSTAIDEGRKGQGPESSEPLERS